MGHHVTPMAGGITNREKDRLVFAARLGKRFFAPGIPIDRIMRVLKQVRGLLMRQPVCVLRLCLLNFYGRRGH